MNYILHTDGGARGNPGPAAIGVVVCNKNDEQLKSYGEYIGETTNNEAEYRAVITGLKKIKSVWGKDQAKKSCVEVRSDSELLVNQMQGKYKIEHPNLQKFFLELWNLRTEFQDVVFTAVLRGKNKEADRLVNEALDGQQSARGLF
ncbi:MAG: ribonuclease HI family protein [bacterium]|nr:ribonuclease HI family protein [bacterium]